jgi:hypothetical protein
MAGETLIEWARAIGLSSSAWRRLDGRSNEASVTSSHITFQPDDYPLVEFSVPGLGQNECHWLVTEALWAPFIREPSVDAVSGWLSGRGAVERLVDGIMGARSRTLLEQAERAERTYKDWTMVGFVAPKLFEMEDPTAYSLRMLDHMRPALAPDAITWLDRKLMERDARGGEATDPPEPEMPIRLDSPAGLKMIEFGARWYQATDRGIQFLCGVVWPAALRWLYFLRAGVVLSAMAGAVLLAYGSLRALLSLIPATSGLFGFVDGFLTRLIGDLQVLLTDPTQAANVRARVGAAIESMAEIGADRVVLIAHSGGAAVAYSTLTDPRYRTLQVDRLVTLGQGLGAAWHILGMDNDAARSRSSRESPLFAADLAETRPQLEWSDYWSTHDPVPGGTPIAIPPWIAAQPTNLSDAGLLNRMSTGDDHGTYWANDEEFVIPVVETIRRLDGTSAAPVWTNRAIAVERRRERVIALAMWRRLSFLAIVAVVLLSFPTRSTNFVNSIGEWLAQAWQFVPFHGFLDAIVAAIKTSIQSVPSNATRAFVDIGNVALVLLIGGVLLSRMPPIGRWRSPLRVWPMVRWVIDLGVFVAIALLAWITLSPWLAANQTSIEADIVPIGLFALLASVLGWLVERSHSRPAKVAMVAMVLTAAVIVVAALAFALILQERVWTFVLGAGIAYSLIRVINGIGTWLWQRWDERERSAARLNSADPASGRRFALVAGAMLLAALAGLGVALVGGTQVIGQALPWAPDVLGMSSARFAYLAPIAFALALFTCLLGVARETVDPWQE